MSIAGAFDNRAFVGSYDEVDDWRTLGVTVWPPPTAHTGSGRSLESMTFAELAALTTRWSTPDNGYFRRSLALELYRKSPRPPSFESYWTADTGWVPCRVG